MTAKLVSNSGRNIIAFTAAIAAQFLLVPVVIRSIGLVEFGRAGLVLAVWAPMSLVGIVLGQAATREIAAARAAGGSGDSLQSAALGLCVVSGVAVALLFILCGPYLLDRLDASSVGIADWRRDTFASAPGWFFQQIFIVMQGVAIAREDFRSVAQTTIFFAVSSVLCTPLPVLFLPDAAGYLWGMSASYAVACLVAVWILRRRGYRLLSGRQGLAPASRSLLRFGRWQVVSQVTGTIGNQIDRYALAALASPVVIGQFNAANRLQEAGYSVVMKAAEVLFPRFGSISHEEEEKRLRLFLVASWAVAVFSGVVLGPLVVVAEPLMRIWAGPEAAAGGAFLLQVLTIGGMVGCGSGVFTYQLMGTGKTGVLAAVSFGYSVITVIVSIAVLVSFGARAAGFGLVLASVIRVGVALLYSKYWSFPGSRWADLLASTVLPIAASIAVSLALSKIVSVAGVHSWPLLAFLLVAASVAIGISSCIASSLTAFGRASIGVVVSEWRDRFPRMVSR